MGKNGKYALAIACQIANKTQKIKQLQNKSTCKYFQNVVSIDAKPDLFVKSQNSMANIYKKSITEEITDRILASIRKEQK